MTDYDAKMMLIDSALINEDAILYFLPKLAEVVLKENIHQDFLKGQINHINKTKLSESEINILNELLQKIETIITETKR